MKKIVSLLLLLVICIQGFSQISFSKEYDKAYAANIIGDFFKIPEGRSNMDSVKKVFVQKVKNFNDSLESKSPFAFEANNLKTAKKIVNDLYKRYSDSIEKYKTLYYYAVNTEKVTARITQKIYKKAGNELPGKTFFRKYAFESIRFFENDTVHLKYFKNNTINYIPSTKQMSLYTEVINDYFAAFRLGVGFQVKTNPISDTANLTDSAKAGLQKDDLVGNLQNQGGGDFNVNVSYPLFKNKTEFAWINYRVYAYGNLGVSLPLLNKNSADFVLNSDIGLQGSFYSTGINENITIYSSFKLAYYFGNDKYRKIIKDADSDNPTSFWICKTSIGLAFMDGYRISFDLYPHFKNDFLKKNFPATVSFIIRPSAKKD